MIELIAILMLSQPAAKPDACALVTNEDVRRVLDADVTQRQPASAEARGLLLFQCYVGTGTPRSVSVAVAGPTKGPKGTVTPRTFWREQFHADAAEQREEKAKKEEETGARPVSGIGDEAYWSGTRVTGALYVLRGDTFIRISVGGLADEQQRIEKSKALASAVLQHLGR
jgi:hypothetical protein